MDATRAILEESLAVSREILRRELRKALGLYYAAWGTYPMAAVVLYYVVENLVAGAPKSAVALSAAVPYIVLTGRIFASFFKAMRLPSRRRKGGIAWSIMILAYFAVLLFAMAFIKTLAFATTAAYAASVTLLTYLLFRSNATEPRWYDHLALISFSVLLPLGVYVVALYYVIGIIWVYAGIKSLLDAME
ncbi:hypothetical protein [Pyrobaculum islandicum]|uniref:hypothetical protein n=1 Tax=Pyrobaculum islandicum TaxID=2277 RepID=UPI00069FD11E|nr:hypothetical protein [Pyrobaculum islandicum]